MLTAVAYRFPASANIDAVRALIQALALTALIAVSFIGVVLLVTALTPVAVACCSATIAALPQMLIVVAVFYGAWLVKP